MQREPDHVQTIPKWSWEATVKGSIESAGGVASRVRIGAHELVFDQASPVPGGQDRGPSPLEVMAFAVAACAHYYAAAFLFGRQLSTEGLRVDVEFEKAQQPAPRISKLSLKVTLPSGLPEQYLPAIERAIRRCPAYGTLKHPPEVELTLSAVALAAG
jgi:putative redox protein